MRRSLQTESGQRVRKARRQRQAITKGKKPMTKKTILARQTAQRLKRAKRERLLLDRRDWE